MALPAGCARPTVEAVSLTVISPHRDEIRQESAEAFQVWFKARTEQRGDHALAALNGWNQRRDAGSEPAVAQACQQLLADWNSEITEPVRAAFQDWQAERNESRTVALQDALRQWRGREHPVTVVWQDIGGGTSQIVRYIRSSFEARQGRPGGIGIDLLYGGGTDSYLRLAEEGLLEKVDVPPEIMRRIPPDLNGVAIYDPEHRWFGPMLTSFGILSNRDVLNRIGEPIPTTWADLGRPGMQSWASAGDPRMSGSVHMVYEIVLQGALGWNEGFRLLMRLGANTHTFIRDSGTLTRMVVNGEVAAAGNLDSNALSAVGRNPDVMTFQLPPGATIINPDGEAVLRGAPQSGLAKAFVEFTLSDAGQRLFFLRPGQPGGPQRFPLCRLSVIKDFYDKYPPEVRSTGTTDPFNVGPTVRYDTRKSIQRWDALNDLFGAWIVDAHPQLVAAWRSVLRSKAGDADRARLEEELFRPPLTEEALARYAVSITEGSPRTRTEATTGWGEEARQRYRGIELAASRQ